MAALQAAGEALPITPVLTSAFRHDARLAVADRQGRACEKAHYKTSALRHGLCATAAEAAMTASSMSSTTARLKDGAEPAKRRLEWCRQALRLTC